MSTARVRTLSVCRATRAAAPSRSPRNPVPYIASTARSARPKARSTASGVGSSPRSSRRSTRTPQPAQDARAVTSPSPPLLPLPQTITARRPYVPPSSRRASHATACPARSISTSTGVPASIVRRSASPICSGVRIGFTSPPRCSRARARPPSPSSPCGSVTGATHRCHAPPPSPPPRPCNATDGAPLLARTTSTSRNLNFHSPTPIAFITASFAPNPRQGS